MTMDDFLVFEKEHACGELHIDNFYYWWYIRNELILQCGCIIRAEAEGKGKMERRLSAKDRIFSLFQFVSACFKFSPFLKGEKNSLFILQDPTVFNPEGGYYECPPTQSVVKNWSGKKTLISDYYTNYLRNAFPVQFPETTFSIYPILAWKMKGRLWRLGGLEKKKKKIIAESIRPILDCLKEQYDCDIDSGSCVALIYRQYLYWGAYYKYYERLIFRLKPLGAVEQCYYSTRKMVFNEAAKKYHVPTIELQHGIMGKEHLAYNSYIMENRTFPDYVFTFSDFWKECTNIPLPDERILAVGYPYLEKRVLKSRKMKKEREFQGRLLLVIGSSDQIDEELRLYLREVCAYVREKGISDFKILYKMHPRFMKRYEEVCGMYAEYGDILHVVSKDEKNLYDCFAIADEQLSVVSTGVYEGIAYGLKTYIYQSKKYTNSLMKDLCEKGGASFVNRPEQLFEVEEMEAENTFKTVWVEHSEERLMDTLNRILKRRNMYESS